MKHFLLKGLAVALMVLALSVKGGNVLAAEAKAAVKVPVGALNQGAEYVGTDTCVSCHEEAGREFKLSPHARISNDKGTEGTAQGCEICHGPGSIHAENGGGKGGAIINPKKDPSICFTCHMEKKMEFKLPSHHPVLEGKMSCSDCHNLHGEDARTSSATSMEGRNEVCFKCHKDQQGPFVYEHAALKDGCNACHKVHGSISDKMLVARDANLCLRCHSDTRFPTSGNIGAGGVRHAGYVQSSTCWSGGCHTNPHGSNFSAALRY